MKKRLLTLVLSSTVFSLSLCLNVHGLETTQETDKEVNQGQKTNSPQETASPPLKQLILLNNKQMFQQAYALAQNLRHNWEGDEVFDFNFALAAAQTGRYSEALFAFERIQESQPNNIRVQLELARCHYFVNNLSASKKGFELVASHNPPANVQKSIDHFLNRIAEKQQQVTQSWSNSLGVSAGYDSNINAAADLDSIDATFFYNNVPALTGVLTLNNDQKAKDSYYYQLQGQSIYQMPLSKRSSLDVSLSGSHKDNTLDDEYDLSNLTINSGFRVLRGQHNIRIGAVARQYWLAGDNLQNQLLANIGWQWFFVQNWKTTTEFEFGRQDNKLNEALDFIQWQGKLAINRKTTDLSQNIQLGIGQDKARQFENEFQGRDYYSLGYQISKPVFNNQQVYGLLNYRLHDYSDAYADDHIFFAGKTRQDKMAQFIAGWVYEFIPATAVKVQASHHINNSNLELYDYQRTLIEAGLTISFK